MTRGRARIHLSSNKGPHTALCGWTYVDHTADASIVTCKACLSTLAGKRTASSEPRAKGKRAASTADVQAELAAAFRATLAPMAPAPPRMTAQLWAASCKGGEHRRCGLCELCEWERDAQLWAHVSPWNRQHVIARPLDAPRWSSLAAALVALVEFELHDRCSPSACGGILDRLQRGAAGDTGERTKPEDPLLRRAGELVRVRQALELAYPDGAHTLPAQRCRALLLMRTPGVLLEMPSYYGLSVLLSVPEGELRALVRTGRKRVEDELATRGLIPVRVLHRRAVAATIHHSYGEAAQ